MSEDWCYEDSDDDCPTGGWLTGNPAFVTCRICIARYRLFEKYSDRELEIQLAAIADDHNEATESAKADEFSRRASNIEWELERRKDRGRLHDLLYEASMLSDKLSLWPEDGFARCTELIMEASERVEEAQ